MYDPKRRERQRMQGAKAFSLILQLGISMLVPIVGCFLLGSFIFKRTGALWPLILLIIAGVGAGFSGCWRLIKRMFLDDSGSEET